MASIGVAGPGWLLQHGTSPTGPWTTIAEVGDIKGPAQQLDTDEITNQSSPSAYKEYIGTLLDGGEVTTTCIFVPGDPTQGSVAGLLSWLQGRGPQYWQLVPPGSYSADITSFTAFVSKWEPGAPVGKHATLDVTLKVTGPVVTAF
jgi:hypothetical protein